MAVVLVLGDGVLERVVNLAQAMLEDAGEADQDRQVDAAELQAVDQLLEIDAAVRVLGGMDQHVPVSADRKISFAPTGDLIQFGGIGGRPALGLLLKHRRDSPGSIWIGKQTLYANETGVARRRRGESFFWRKTQMHFDFVLTSSAGRPRLVLLTARLDPNDGSGRLFRSCYDRPSKRECR